jgi:MerR family transcriptional regulator/heat shock protein HspR
MKVKKNKGFFSISAVAKMFSIHQQTIRLYEKEGLISPARSAGNTRLFTEDDIDRLEEIIHLTHKLGINLAGVEMIFRLKKKIDKMQKEMNKAFDHAKEQLHEETEVTKEAVRSTAKQLIKLKQQSITDIPSTKKTNPEEQIIEVENWDIEYEED